MSTMLWLPSNTTAAVSPTPSATDWDGHVNSVSRQLLFAPNGSALTTLAYAPDAGDDITDVRTMAAQFVSDVLPPQTIPVTAVQISLLCAEDDALNNLFFSWKLYACSVGGTSNLGDIVPVQNDATEMVAATLTGIWDRDAVTTAFSSLVPFRLCLEVGWDGLPTSGAGTNAHNGSLRLGATALGFAQDLSTLDRSPALNISVDIKHYTTVVPGALQRGVMSGGMA